MINNFKDNPVAAAYVAMYEKQTAVDESVDELEEATVKVERADWVPEEISDEGVADFMGAAAAAAKKGDKTFKFGDKEYKVTMKKSTADAIDEGYSPQEIKQAIGIASDKRYAGGNMTGATSAIEKLKAGLSDHPQVKAVLKSKNEKVSEGVPEKTTEAYKPDAAAITKMIKDIAMSDASPEHKKAAIDALTKMKNEEDDMEEGLYKESVTIATKVGK